MQKKKKIVEAFLHLESTKVVERDMNKEKPTCNINEILLDISNLFQIIRES